MLNQIFDSLAFNNLQGSIPTELGTLTELELLWLDENQLIGTIPTELSNLKYLTWLRLHKNDLTGMIPSEIGDLTRLTRLALHENSFSGQIPVEIAQLSNLGRSQDIRPLNYFVLLHARISFVSTPASWSRNRNFATRRCESI